MKSLGFFWPMLFPEPRCVVCRELVPWVVAIPVLGPRLEHGRYRHVDCLEPK